MMWPGPRSDQELRARFQWTTCHPPVPSWRSTAVVLSTTASPTATGPTTCVSAYAGPWSVATRWRPARSLSSSTTRAVTKAGMGAAPVRLEAGDQLLDPLVPALERVLAQDGALGLVVELQVHPVDRVGPLALLGPADELAPQPCPRGLGRQVHGG